ESAGFQADSPRMERAHHRFAGHDSVGQRAALVRATVVDGEKAIAEVEEGDLPPAGHRRAPLTRRDVLAGRDAQPPPVAHACTPSMDWIGMNCIGCTGAWPSSQASRARAFD